MKIFPWHLGEFDRLLDEKSRLPHAILIQGPHGIGKAAFAQTLAQALLCESPEPSGAACGRCAACHWLEAGTHPDYRQIEPESLAEADTEEQGGDKKKASLQITIEQIRALPEFIGISSHRGGPKVVLIHPAEALNIAFVAANDQKPLSPADAAGPCARSRHRMAEISGYGESRTQPRPGRQFAADCAAIR
jgi:DNA polymerase-3 subunit delta'